MQESQIIKDKLVSAIDRTLEQGQWEGGLFFKNIRKRLESLRDFVQQELVDTQALHLFANSYSARLEAEKRKLGYDVVYIAIYQANGEFLEKWVNPIKALTERSVSRPVYQSEAHVAELIRAKRSRNDGYVAVWVKPTDILNRQNFSAKDRLGHPVLALKDGSVRPENIIEFVYDNRRFNLKESQLIVKE